MYQGKEFAVFLLGKVGLCGGERRNHRRNEGESESEDAELEAGWDRCAA